MFLCGTVVADTNFWRTLVLVVMDGVSDFSEL